MENQIIKVLIVDFVGANISKIKAALSKMSGMTYDISWTQVGENILNKVEEEKKSEIDNMMFNYIPGVLMSTKSVPFSKTNSK